MIGDIKNTVKILAEQGAYVVNPLNVNGISAAKELCKLTQLSSRSLYHPTLISINPENNLWCFRGVISHTCVLQVSNDVVFLSVKLPNNPDGTPCFLNFAINYNSLKTISEPVLQHLINSLRIYDINLDLNELVQVINQTSNSYLYWQNILITYLRKNGCSDPTVYGIGAKYYLYKNPKVYSEIADEFYMKNGIIPADTDAHKVIISNAENSRNVTVQQAGRPQLSQMVLDRLDKYKITAEELRRENYEKKNSGLETQDFVKKFQGANFSGVPRNIPVEPETFNKTLDEMYPSLTCLNKFVP